MRLEELKSNFIFYRQDDDGLHKCLFAEADFKNRPAWAMMIKNMTSSFITEGRLFVRKSKPGQAFPV